MSFLDIIVLYHNITLYKIIICTTYSSITKACKKHTFIYRMGLYIWENSSLNSICILRIVYNFTQTHMNLHRLATLSILQ